MIHSLTKENEEDNIYCLTKLSQNKHLNRNTNELQFHTCTSDIETLVIEYGNHADQFNIIDSFEILNKINFIKLKSLILYTNWYVTSDACWVESNYFNDLLHRMNVIDKFVTSNQFE